ncbi:MAG TPA: 3-deoxy-D-manno-octulosonic acid transferase [Verrucomicrobiae bacterium]|nr:3-deoxy-D-manno-octulosonic acid transferase [Verrucomicrobiae bacterium]
MALLYRILTAASVLILAPYYAWRGWRRREPRQTLRDRFGFLSPQILERANAASRENRPVWIHAVSVGEVLAAQPLLEGLRARFPARPLYVSTTTETGQRLARERFSAAADLFYFPLDWTTSVRRALRSLRPALIIIMETEIWPNFLRVAHEAGVAVIFANARISERSMARFERWKFLVGDFFERILQWPALFLAQTSEDAARLASMGAPEERVEVTGNLKYDSEPPPATPFLEWLAGQIKNQERWPVLVAGSVVAEEESHVLAAWDLVQRQWRHSLLILAPRKPDRFDAAAALCHEGGWNVVRRSQINLSLPLDDQADILLLDSIGELAGLYSIAEAVFVGGSLVRSGGHNILEPAWYSKPPVFGPSMENFQEMAGRFLSARAGIQVDSGPMLGRVWIQLIEDAATRQRAGEAAKKIYLQNRGAALRSLDRIAALLASGDEGECR